MAHNFITGGTPIHKNGPIQTFVTSYNSEFHANSSVHVTGGTCACVCIYKIMILSCTCVCIYKIMILSCTCVYIQDNDIIMYMCVYIR